MVPKTIRLTRPIEITREGSDYLVTVPETGQILLMNEAAAFIATELEGGSTRPQILARFESRFGLEAGRAALDLDRALHDLAIEGLIDHDRL